MELYEDKKNPPDPRVSRVSLDKIVKLPELQVKLD